MSLISKKEDVIPHLLDSLQEEVFCDMKIVATDGEISANRTILSLRSEYFKTMFFSQHNYVEGQTRRVKLPYSKDVLEKLVLYLYGGEMDRGNMSLSSLLQMMDLLDLVILPSELSIIEEYVETNIKAGTFPVSDCLKALVICSEKARQNVGDHLMSYLGKQFRKFSESREVGTLSQPIITRLLEEGQGDNSQAIYRLRTLINWLSVNTMEDEIKNEVIQLLELESFTFEELASDVRKSGLFSTDLIMDRMDQLYKQRGKEVKDMLPITISSAGPSAEHRGECLGLYDFIGRHNNAPAYRQRNTDPLTQRFLYKSMAGMWSVGPKLVPQCRGWLFSNSKTPSVPLDNWRFLKDDSWVPDRKLTITRGSLPV